MKYEIYNCIPVLGTPRIQLYSTNKYISTSSSVIFSSSGLNNNKKFVYYLPKKWLVGLDSKCFMYDFDFFECAMCLDFFTNMKLNFGIRCARCAFELKT